MLVRGRLVLHCRLHLLGLRAALRCHNVRINCERDVLTRCTRWNAKICDKLKEFKKKWRELRAQEAEATADQQTGDAV